MSNAPTAAINTLSVEQEKHEPSAEYRAKSRIPTLAEYERLYKESLESPETFWARESQDLVFHSKWTTLLERDPPSARWFVGAKLNASESCLDRHLKEGRQNKRALIWEGEDGSTRSLTYAELHAEVVRFASLLVSLGVNAGDRVTLYMGMVPEAVIAMLGCARIGAPHSVVFGGFAADSLRGRINDCQAKIVVTQDAAPRRGKLVPLKQTVDEALKDAPSVEKVIVLQHVGAAAGIQMQAGRDIDWKTAVASVDTKLAEKAKVLDAEHPLFILYTSGSTGKPKGVLHTTAGYLVGTHVSTKYVFDIQENDIYWCTADVGWITGHSYLVYGPLSNGMTCLMYEGAPNHPDWGRFWQIIDKHKVSILYTAPTAIRAFIRAGDEWVDKADLSSLRLLGSVGEPINPEAWMWYHRKIGKSRCPIVDTWWQTETGSILMTTLPGASYAKPGSTGLPFFGAEPDVVTGDGTSVKDREGGLFIMRRPWPSMLRTIWGDHERYKQQYFSEVPGNLYFSGDGAHRDSDGYYQVIGRIDDVLNVSGHRIGTAEVESSLVAHKDVAEAAVVGRPDELTGQALVAFVTLKPGAARDDAMKQALKQHVGKDIGKFAAPDDVRFADALPKTRSGKIMRRLLKDVASGREITGDTSTLEDPNVLVQLRQS
ncbi:MAG TPA: acetate--CoA ligase [Polyangiaceae bacterium]|jgi:acetyl-CoA synthetase|nr:acetate--CoA ligase [Polyangiaceae bacterium]